MREQMRKKQHKKNCIKLKEEEELFPFNLDEFVNMDEVLEVHVIIDNPPPPWLKKYKTDQFKIKEHRQENASRSPFTRDPRQKSWPHPHMIQVPWWPLGRTGTAPYPQSSTAAPICGPGSRSRKGGAARHPRSRRGRAQ